MLLSRRVDPAASPAVRDSDVTNLPFFFCVHKEKRCTMVLKRVLCNVTRSRTVLSERPAEVARTTRALPAL